MQSNAHPNKVHGPQQEFSIHSILDLFNITFNSLSVSLYRPAQEEVLSVHFKIQISKTPNINSM